MEGFREARHNARMTVKDVAEYLQISISTVKRYDKTNHGPKSVIECLRMMGGQFPAFSRRKNTFEGWSLGQGFLWSPAGEKFTSGDVLASRLDKALADSLYIANERLRKEKEAAREKTDNVIPFPSRRRFSDSVA